MVSSSHERGKHWYNLNISKQAKALQISSYHDSQSIAPRILKENIGGNVICQQSHYLRVGTPLWVLPTTDTDDPTQHHRQIPDPQRFNPFHCGVCLYWLVLIRGEKIAQNTYLLASRLYLVVGLILDLIARCLTAASGFAAAVVRDRIPMVPIVGWFFNCQWNESWAPRKSGIHVRYSWVMFLHTEEKLVY